MISLNLLPPEEKKAISVNKLNYYFSLFSGGLFISLVIFSLILAGIVLFINKEVKIAEVDFNSAQSKLKLEGFKELHETVSQTNNQITELAKIQQTQVSYLSILGKIVEIIPAGVRLSNLSFSQNKVDLDGFSSNRQLVLDMKQALEHDPHFEKIESPITNLIKSTNIDFHFSFQIKDNIAANK